MAFQPIPLPCDLAFPPPSHRDATTPSLCWAPHFMTQEHIMFSNPTPSKPLHALSRSRSCCCSSSNSRSCSGSHSRQARTLAFTISLALNLALTLRGFSLLPSLASFFHCNHFRLSTSRLTNALPIDMSQAPSLMSAPSAPTIVACIEWVGLHQHFILPTVDM